MIRLAVPIVIFLLTLFAGAVWALYGYLDLSQVGEGLSDKPVVASKATPPGPDGAAKQDPASAHDLTATFDVARIDPNGTSVFAGRAEPGARVTIMGEGKPIGTADADENGEWTFAVEHKFASANPDIGLVVKPESEAKRDDAAKTGVAGYAEAREELAAKPNAGERPTAKAVTSHLLKDFEGIVEEARTAALDKGMKAETETALPPAGASAPSNVTAVNLAPSATVRKTIPVPITFVFNEASFTDDGRKAAGLLLEYLQLKHFAKVSLTGHADERGSDELNITLSKERLDTVANYLREAGFKGTLDLIPKGKSEPFTGVVRSQYPQEELYQLDRRVELVIAP